jgi:hypothetical protein
MHKYINISETMNILTLLSASDLIKREDIFELIIRKKGHFFKSNY